MTIYFAADHRGFVLKESLMGVFRAQGYKVIDCGNKRLDFDDDYPDFTQALAWSVNRTPGSRGVAMCGSGTGMAIAANKVRGIRAAVARTVADARDARHDEDVNVLCLGADYLEPARAQEIVNAFLVTAASSEPRHVRRRLKLE